MAAIDQLIYPGVGPATLQPGDAQIAAQMEADFVTRRDVAMEAVEETEDGAFFRNSMATFLMKTGRVANTNTTKHTFFQNASRFKSIQISAVSVSGAVATVTINPNYVFELSTQNWDSPGQVKDYVMLPKSGVRGQVTAVSKPSTGGSKPTHTMAITFNSNSEASSIVIGDWLSIHANINKEKDTFPGGMTQTQSRYDAFFTYMMTSRPEQTMLAMSLAMQYSVNGSNFQDAIARIDTYVRHELFKSVELMIGDGSSINGRQTVVGALANAKAFGLQDQNVDLSTTAAVKAWARRIGRYADFRTMGGELTVFMGNEFQQQIGAALLDNIGTATQTNARYNTFGTDADAQKRAVNLGVKSLVNSDTGLTLHFKKVVEYGHPGLFNPEGYTLSGANAYYYQRSAFVSNLGRGANGSSLNNTETAVIPTGGSPAGLRILQLVQRNGDGTQATRNTIFRGSAILGYEAATETLTETWGLQMTNPQKSMFFVGTSF